MGKQQALIAIFEDSDIRLMNVGSIKEVYQEQGKTVFLLKNSTIVRSIKPLIRYEFLTSRYGFVKSGDLLINPSISANGVRKIISYISIKPANAVKKLKAYGKKLKDL